MADLPEAGAQLVLEGVSEFMNNMAAVTSGLAKVAQGLIALSGTSVSTAGLIDSSSQRIVTANQRIGDSAQGLVDRYGKALGGVVTESNAAATAVEQSASRIVRAMGEATSRGGTTPRMGGAVDEQSPSVAAHERLKQAAKDLADVTAREANRRATAEEQASRRVVDALIAEANAAVRAMSEEEAALARITQEQNAASNARVEAMAREQQGVSGGSLNFVRAITGMVAANNLLNIGALNTAFNIGTLAASFDRMGTRGLLLGGALGVALAAVASLVQAFGTIVSAGQAVISTIGDITAKVIDFGVQASESALKAASAYQNAMAFFVALTGAPIEDLQKLNDKIFQVATTTKVGMPGAIEAVNELGRAGQNASQIINDGALDATIALFTAANGELVMGDAAKTLTGSVGAFTKTLADGKTQTIAYSEAANAVTAAAQLSRLSFTEITQAFRQAAPVANSANISIGDLAAVIAVLGNASETGTLSGTALKQVILDLEHPSKKAAAALNEFDVSLFDGEGKLRPFRDVIIDMNNAFGESAVATGKATDQTRLKALGDIFGSRAALAANIITNQGVEAFDKMKTAMEGVTAVDMANVLLLPLDARMTILTNSVQALAITFAGPFVSALSDAVNTGISFIRNTEGLRETVELAGQAIVAIATNSGFGALQEKLEQLSDPRMLGFFTSIIGFGSSVRAALVDVIAPALQTVLNRVVEFASNQQTIDAWASAIDNAGRIVLGVASVISGAITMVADFVGWLHENQAAMEAVQTVAIGFATVIGGVVVASLIAAAIPIAVVTLAMAALGAMVVAVATDIQVFATAIMSFVADPAQEAAGIVVDAGVTMAEGATEGAIGVVGAFEIVAEASAALAGVVVDNTEVMVEGVIDDTNVMVQGTADGWDNMGDVTKSGVDGVGKTLAELDPVMTAVANAPGESATSWASGFTSVLHVIQDFVSQAWSMIKGFLDSLASNPLFAAVAGFAGGPIFGPMVIGATVVNKAIHSIGDAASAAGREVRRIGDSVTPIIANFQNLEGRLRSSLDNISSSAQRARDNVAGIGGERTVPGEYPGGGGAGGGGKGRGGGADHSGDAYNKALDQAVEFAEDLARTIQNAGVDAIAKLQEVAQKAALAAANETRDYIEKVNSIGDDFVKGVLERVQQTAQSRADRARKKELSDTLSNNAEQRRLDREDRDQSLADIREANDRKDKLIQDHADTAFQHEQQDKATKRSQDRSDEDTAFKRKLDDEESRIQRMEELRNKHTTRQTGDDIRKMQAAAFTVGGAVGPDNGEAALRVQNDRLARARAREDMETARSRGRAAEDVQFTRDEAQLAENYRLGVEDAALTRRHNRALEDRAQKREDARTDLDQHKADALATQSLDDRMQDEASERANQKAKTDAQAKAAIAGREHKERLDAITQRAIDEGNTILVGLDKTLRGVQDKINDKVPEILKSGGAAMQPILDDLIGNINKDMDTVWENAHRTRLELGLGEAGTGASTIQSMGLATNNFITASVNFTQAMIDAAARITAAASGGSGSTIPTSPGAVVPPYTTGQVGSAGLGFTPSPSQYSPPAGTGGGLGINPPQSLPSSTVVAPSAASVTVNNVTNNSVSANYANSQSPASIAMDLGALSAISRR